MKEQALDSMKQGVEEEKIQICLKDRDYKMDVHPNNIDYISTHQKKGIEDKVKQKLK